MRLSLYTLDVERVLLYAVFHNPCMYKLYLAESSQPLYIPIVRLCVRLLCCTGSQCVHGKAFGES